LQLLLILIDYPAVMLYIYFALINQLMGDFFLAQEVIFFNNPNHTKLIKLLILTYYRV